MPAEAVGSPPKPGLTAAPASDTAAAERIAHDGPVTISFEPGAATLSTTQRAALKKFADRVVVFPAVTRVSIEGHTDNPLDDAASLKLSGKRAQAVKAYVAAMIGSRERLVAIGFGKNLPVAANSDAKGRAANNRVEIEITEIYGKPRPREDPPEGGTVFP